ncbi:MAG: IS200/IS605 family transposase [Candidatus Sumerlaeaceae bacterium]
MGHSHTRYLYHFVWSTKHREPWITNDVEAQVYAYVTALLIKSNAHVFAINGMPDHVHAIVELRAEPSVGRVVKDAKAYSSGWFKRRFGRSAFAWQTGYGGFTISTSQLDKAIGYVQRQKVHHRKTGFDFAEEMKMLCKLHGVEFDSKMLE